MRFKRFLAILLLLLLPLQSSFAAVDYCCALAAESQAGTDTAGAHMDDGSASQAGSEANCCAACDFCNHSSHSVFQVLTPGQLRLPGMAPTVRPEAPFHSFIPDVPSRPDLA